MAFRFGICVRLREAAGLSRARIRQRRSANRNIPTSVFGNERQRPRSDAAAADLAKALGVTVENCYAPRRQPGRLVVRRRLRQVFEAGQAAPPPAKKVADFVGAFVKQHANGDA